MSSWRNNSRPITHFPQINSSNLPITSNNIFVPTFHILISTVGRPSLKIMLDSLKNELSEKDAITIVFDGEGTFVNSKFNHLWTIGHKAKINTIEQNPNLGHWGHAIRNKYQSLLNPRTTFIMNADDDDFYVPGTFNKLRRICLDPNTLYIAKMWMKRRNIIAPSQLQHIIQNDIGTPCGIIPFDIANKSTWEYKYGGDFDYYNKLQEFTQKQFIDLIIYITP